LYVFSAAVIILLTISSPFVQTLKSSDVVLSGWRTGEKRSVQGPFCTRAQTDYTYIVLSMVSRPIEDNPFDQRELFTS